MQAWFAGQSLLLRHCTHAPSLQRGVPDGQSVSPMHCTQTSLAPQNVPFEDPAQSALVRHSAHSDRSRSQTGVLPEHWASLVQPSMHVKAPGLQMGRATPQSALSRQATHCPVGTKHRGAVLPAQSASLAHATQELVAGRHTPLFPLQSLDELHATQSPAALLQIGVACGHDDESVQGAWQRWSPGQQAGAAAGQSSSDPQAAHFPRAATHTGLGCAQSELVRHSTHPSCPSHFSLPGH